MVADVQLGVPYVAAVNLVDVNGSPLAGAVGAGGTLNVYGPASATTVVYTDTAADLGGGDYGVTVPAANLTAGFHRFTIPTITVGTYTFVNAGGWFRVGDIPPEYRTLRAILTQVLVGTGMAVASTSTALGSTTTLKDTRWYDTGLSSNEFLSDELLILEPGLATDASPVRVSTFDPSTGATGTFTFRPAVGSAVASGSDYLLVRANQWGDRYAQVRALVDDTIADLCRRATATDTVTLTTASQTVDYTLPAGFLTVDRVEFDPEVTAQYQQWQEVAPVYWEHYPDRRLLHFGMPLFDEGLALRITGQVAPPVPRSLGDLVHAPATAIIDAVSAMLALPPHQRAGIRMGRAAREQSRSGGW